MPFCSAQFAESHVAVPRTPEFWITAARSFALGEVERMTSVRVVSPEWQGDFSPGCRVPAGLAPGTTLDGRAATLIVASPFFGAWHPSTRHAARRSTARQESTLRYLGGVGA